MNKKGFVITTTVFIVMLIVAGAISLAYGPLLNSRFSLVQTKKQLVSLVELQNAIERVHGMIFSGETISTATFESLGIDIIYEENSGAFLEQPVDVISQEKGEEISLELSLVSNTIIEIIVGYAVPWNTGNQYPDGISKYSYKLIHTETNTIIQQEWDVVGWRTIVLSSETMALGNYILEVIPNKVAVKIEGTYELIQGEQDIIYFYKDGELIHTQYVK